MKLFRSSVRRKLTLMTMASSSIALLLSCAGFLFYDLVTFRYRMISDLMTQAEIIGANATAALAFRDDQAAAEVLSALKARGEIVAAGLYIEDGTLFAQYANGTTVPQSTDPAFPPDSSRFESGYVKAFHNLTIEGKPVGLLVIYSDMRQWSSRLVSYTTFVGIFIVVAAGAALLISNRLQRLISEPILRLEKTMQTVSHERNYALRAEKTTDDEVGALIDGFNAMLAEIQHTEYDLHRLNESLEHRVAERTEAAEQRAKELAKSEKALRHQKNILQSVLNSMGDGVVVADEHGRILLYNPAAERILKTSLNNFSTRGWYRTYRVYHQDTVTPYPLNDVPIVRAMRGEEPQTEEVFLRNAKSPEGMWLSLNAKPLRGEDGLTPGGVMVFRDITENRNAQERLLHAKEMAEQASRTKSAFLANMSHELRTPLNAIIGYSELLQEQVEELTPAELQSDLQKIHSSGRHLLGLINDILDLSKIEAGKFQLSVEAFDLAASIDEVVGTVRPLALANGNILDVSCPRPLIMTSDAMRIRQVLLNLLSNSCKFTRQGEISVAVATQTMQGSEWVQITVKDTGIGITPEKMARLFEPFVQAEPTTTRKFGGTGLGLAITHKFCQLLGGTISANSELGQGSQFTMEFPLIFVDGSKPHAAVYSPTVTEADPVSKHNGHFLVMDDDPAARDLLSRLIRKEGFEVTCCSSALDGLSIASKIHPLAITLDIMMDGIDGWEALKRLKADPALRSIPVIVSTIVDDRQKAYALGAAEYLPKPIDQDLFATILQRYRHTDATPAGEAVPEPVTC